MREMITDKENFICKAQFPKLHSHDVQAEILYLDSSSAKIMSRLSKCKTKKEAVDLVKAVSLEDNITAPEYFKEAEFQAILKNKGMDFQYNIRSVTNAAIDITFFVTDSLLQVFLGILAAYLYDKLKALGKKDTNLSILVVTEKKEVRFYENRTLEEFRREIYEYDQKQ